MKLINKNKFTLILLSFILALLYSGLALDRPKEYFHGSKSLFQLRGPNLLIEFQPFSSRRYLLIIKHWIQDNQGKAVTFNGDLISPFKIRNEKIKNKRDVEADYFYIEPQAGGYGNYLDVQFGYVYSPELEVQLLNLLPIPWGFIRNDLVVIFKANMGALNFNLIKWAVSFLLFLSFFISAALFLSKYSKRNIFYIIVSASPFILLTGILMLNNLLPYNQYRVIVSPFLFFLFFLLIFFFSLILVIPKELIFKEGNLKKIFFYDD